MGTYEKKVNQLKDLMVRKYKSAYNKSKEMDIDISSMTYLPEPDVFNVMYTEHMSVILDRVNKIMKGNCDIVKGHKLYIALKKAINEKKVAVIRFDTDQPICISTRIMNPSFGVIMDEYGKDIFQGNLKLINVPKGVKDLIVNYIEKYRKL